MFWNEPSIQLLDYAFPRVTLVSGGWKALKAEFEDLGDAELQHQLITSRKSVSAWNPDECVSSNGSYRLWGSSSGDINSEQRQQQQFFRNMFSVSNDGSRSWLENLIDIKQTVRQATSDAVASTDLTSAMPTSDSAKRVREKITGWWISFTRGTNGGAGGAALHRSSTSPIVAASPSPPPTFALNKGKTINEYIEAAEFELGIDEDEPPATAVSATNDQIDDPPESIIQLENGEDTMSDEVDELTLFEQEVEARARAKLGDTL